MKYLLLPAFLSLFLPLGAQSIFYVDHSASGSGNGHSWSDAFNLLQDALAIAQAEDEVWVAAGTYFPGAQNDRYAFYNLPSGVKVYGGFSGHETALEQRDWVINHTILSGDIGTPGDSTDNSFCILYAYSPDEKTRLDGLFFEEGTATNTDNSIDSHRPTKSGGAIYLDGEHFGFAQLKIANCTFRKNRAQHQGGAIYANGREGGMALLRLENCLFEYNVSQLLGGAISQENYFDQPYDLEIKHCTFRNNYAFSSGSAAWLRTHQDVSFSDCNFYNNWSNAGGVVYFSQLESNHNVRFAHCNFNQNSSYCVFYSPNHEAPNTAGFHFRSCNFTENGLPVLSVSFLSAATVKAEVSNCIFDHNYNPANPYTYGGSVVAISGKPVESGIIFSNTLFYKNLGREISAYSARVQNCIFIDHVNQYGSYSGVFSGTDTFKVQNCLFRVPSCDSLQANWPPSLIIDCNSSNRFDIDPQFENPAASDFHLQACSPGINAGANAILDTLNLLTDIEGHPRIRNEIVDIGPYERHLSLQPVLTSQISCAGASDAGVSINPDLCPPYAFEWSNGVTTGTNTKGLAAGTYIFTTTGANNVPIFDTVTILEPLPLEVSAQGHQVTCFAAANGWAEATASGGTPPYVYTWEGIVSPSNLPAGAYVVMVEDANGCIGTASAQVGSVDPIQVFFSVYPASCLACADGSIIFDSISGGINPSLPAPAFNLKAGDYCLTITDAVNCQKVVCFTIPLASATQEQLVENMFKISPNPAASGAGIWLEWTFDEAASIKVLDAQGRIMDEKQLGSGNKLWLNTPLLPGLYHVSLQTASGKSAVRLLAVY